jgi:hypothetical protein
MPQAVECGKPRAGAGGHAFFRKAEWSVSFTFAHDAVRKDGLSKAKPASSDADARRVRSRQAQYFATTGVLK